ncbi:uroporphyrinogen-III C-methyltransferase [Azoarcus indigens]|uniref:uroporphyrinogen-III C-methyltransferase n=1 Tax=Azoarcus indigens TaxID=29545 RepID=UPI00319DA8BD
MIALIAAAVAGWQAWDTRQRNTQTREELARRLAESDTAATEVRALNRQQQEALATLQGKLGALESKVEATEGQAAALEALYQEFSRSREDRVVAEVEQAISIAAQQLQLAGNLEAALIALQGAEARLAASDRGQLAPLRRALSNDIEQLKRQPDVDVPGVALRLERLLERADALPLAFAGEAAVSPESPAAAPIDNSGGKTAAALAFVGELARDVWHEMRDLVRVERLDQTEPVLLAPAQSTFLRENLKIRLLTARLALLARDGRTYAADLAQARNWMERFFDLRDPRVKEAVQELRVLEVVPVSVQRLSLNESFAALRVLQARAGDLRPPAPAAEAARPANGQGNGAAAPQR